MTPQPARPMACTVLPTRPSAHIVSTGRAEERLRLAVGQSDGQHGIPARARRYPLEVSVTRAEFFRAEQTEDFFLVVIGNVEQGDAHPELRVITDRLGQLAMEPSGSVSLEGVRAARRCDKRSINLRMRTRTKKLLTSEWVRQNQPTASPACCDRPTEEVFSPPRQPSAPYLFDGQAIP